MTDYTPEYLALTNATPIPLAGHVITCPYCESEDVSCTDVEETMLGWFSTDPLENPNHRWEYHACNGCSKTFCVEKQRNNVWYTTDRIKVLRGVSSCYETYLYTCKCSGDVLWERRNLDGVLETRNVTFIGPHLPRHQILVHHAVCQSCKAEARVHLPTANELEYA